MASLVIVESPAKARTIERFLGKGYRVEASFGHVRDLPAARKELPERYRSEPWADLAVNVHKDFEPVYVVSAAKKKHIDTLKKALKGADELLLATDEDREGESISWHLLEVLRPKVPVKRIVFHEITREAIKEALANAREVDEHLVHAQEGRRVLDRLFGYRLSPVLWRKVQPGLSAGRVQSVAVRLIVEREEERRRFRSGEFWDMEALIGPEAGSAFKATLVSAGGKRLATGKDFDPATGKLTSDKVLLLTEETADRMLPRLEEALPWEVRRVEEKPASQRPAPPFITSTLQQEAWRKLRLPARRSMQIAQKLYEGVDLGGGERVGLITYMRTDSVTLSKKALGDAQDVIRETYGADYAGGPRQYRTKQRSAQEAHEAIRPTEIHRKPAQLRNYLAKDELALYELIWKRTVASQMPDAKLRRTSVEIIARSGEGKEAIFTAAGKRILFPGFLRAYVEGSDDPASELGDQETVLPDLREGQKIYAPGGSPDKEAMRLEKLEPKKHETQPPARYTEASLVKKLEEESIGRPSTYASIIGTIQDRGYVSVNKSGQLVPTFTAMVVTNLLREHFGEYVDIKFTARMEEELDQIAEGKRSWVEHLRSFYFGESGRPGLDALVEQKKDRIDFPRVPLGEDPESGELITVRVGKFGPYLVKGDNGSMGADVPADVAPADLDMEQVRRLFAQKEEGPRVLGEDPETGETVYALTGRFGDYVQLGEKPKDKKAPKPKRASLEKGMNVETVTLEEALRLLSLPRELGPHPDTGEPVRAAKGRYGPFVAHGKELRSLKDEDDVYTITLQRALELLAEPKQTRGRQQAAKTVLKELGKDKEDRTVQVLDGRYGPYVSDGKTNATLPRGTDPQAVTREEADELLEAKRKAGPSKRKAGGRRKPAK